MEQIYVGCMRRVANSHLFDGKIRYLLCGEDFIQFFAMADSAIAKFTRWWKSSIYTESRNGVVSMMMCDCEGRIGIEIDSYKLFEELKDFFEIQVKLKIYSEVKVSTPYYIGYDIEGGQMEWNADKWYKCNYCGVLWEFRYPDFPAEGFVRKFEDESC